MTVDSVLTELDRFWKVSIVNGCMGIVERGTKHEPELCCGGKSSVIFLTLSIIQQFYFIMPKLQQMT